MASFVAILQPTIRKEFLRAADREASELSQDIQRREQVREQVVITGKPVKLQGFLERNPGGQAISELNQDLQNVLEVSVTERSTMFTPN